MLLGNSASGNRTMLSRSQVRRPDHYTTESHLAKFSLPMGHNASPEIREISPVHLPCILSCVHGLTVEPTCSCVCVCLKSYEAHMLGEKHRKTRAQAPAMAPETCRLCKVTCIDSRAMEAHLNGARHRKMSAPAQTMAPQTCHLCNIVCYDAHSMETHITGHKHMKVGVYCCCCCSCCCVIIIFMFIYYQW